MEKLDYYKLMRNFWDFAFENPEVIKPVHCALFAFTVEHCNRLGWKEKFGLPASMVLDAIGIKSYSVYKKTFDELVEFGFIEVIQYSRNQHSSNIVALKENYKAHYKAYDKASIKHVTKHVTKQLPKHVTKHGEYNKTNIHSTNIPIYHTEIENFGSVAIEDFNFSHSKILKFESPSWLESVAMQQKITIEEIQNKIDEFVLFLSTTETQHKSKKAFLEHFINWLTKKNNSEKNGKQQINASSGKKQFRFSTSDAIETIARGSE